MSLASSRYLFELSGLFFMKSNLNPSSVFYLVFNSFLNISNFTLSSLILSFSASSSPLSYLNSSFSLSLFALKNPIFSESIWSLSACSLTFIASLSNLTFSIQYLSSCSCSLSFSICTDFVSWSYSCSLIMNSLSSYMISYSVSFNCIVLCFNSLSYYAISLFKSSFYNCSCLFC